MPFIVTFGHQRLRKAHDQRSSLERLIEDTVPRMQADVLIVLAGTGAMLARETIGRLLTLGDDVTLTAVLSRDWDDNGEQDLRDALIAAMVGLGLAAVRVTPGPEGVSSAPELALEALLMQYATMEIDALTLTTRAAIPDILAMAHASELPLADQIDLVQNTLGLTSRQVQTIARYRAGLEAAGESSQRISAMLARRITALRQQRAETIARTEAQNAVVLGQEAVWQDAVQRGLVQAGDIRRYWVIGAGACPTICALIPGMNQEGRGLEEPFETPIGPIMRPTAHPNCKCSLAGRWI